MKKILILLSAVITGFSVNAKTLVVYYSYSHNIEKIVRELSSQIEADVLEIEPAEKDLDYEANGYAIGSALISAIRNNPDEEASYPAIDPVNVNISEYDNIVIGTPLWWSNMAAPMQTFLFQYGDEMAGKKIGLIVSSHSSGISGVESDVKRLIPDGEFVSPSLWIRSSQTQDCKTLLTEWISSAFPELSLASDIATVFDSNVMTISVNAHTLEIGNVPDKAILDIFSMVGTHIYSGIGRKVNFSHSGSYIICCNGDKRKVIIK